MSSKIDPASYIGIGVGVDELPVGVLTGNVDTYSGLNKVRAQAPADVTPTNLIVVAVGNHTADQGPTQLDTTHQVLFGAGGTLTGDMVINADGSVTCFTTGSYLFFTNLTYGRSGGGSTAKMIVRVLIDGVQLGGSGVNWFDNANTRLTKLSSFLLPLSAGEVFTMEIARDSNGGGSANDGGLFAINPVTPTYNNAASASVAIYKE